MQGLLVELFKKKHTNILEIFFIFKNKVHLYKTKKYIDESEL
jgi:hypothetical protein